MVQLVIMALLTAYAASASYLAKKYYDEGVVAKHEISKAKEVLELTKKNHKTELEGERKDCQGKLVKLGKRFSAGQKLDQAEKVYKIKAKECQKLLREEAKKIAEKSKGLLK